MSKSVSYLLYNFTSIESVQGSDGVVGHDSFEYMLADSNGYNSTVATVYIDLTTPLVAQTSHPVVIRFALLI